MRTAQTFACPGRDMPQPPGAPHEGYVACYRAGHKCQPRVIRTVRDHVEEITCGCACCGTPYWLQVANTSEADTP